VNLLTDISDAIKAIKIPELPSLMSATKPPHQRWEIRMPLSYRLFGWNLGAADNLQTLIASKYKLLEKLGRRPDGYTIRKDPATGQKTATVFFWSKPDPIPIKTWLTGFGVLFAVFGTVGLVAAEARVRREPEFAPRTGPGTKYR